jgi:hypothetical protein
LYWRAPKEAAMKILNSFLLSVAVTAAGAQTTNQSQVRHVETSLNHLTVLEFGEPVTTLALADTDSFQVERHEDKIFVKPLREGVSTNLFVWTASRELSYELDPAGQLTSMDVLIRTEPAPHPRSSRTDESEPTNAELQKVVSLVLAQAMMGAENISNDNHKQAPDRVLIVLNQAYRSKDQLYIRYTVTNGTKTPFRLTTPDVETLTATQQPISLLGLRNHQLAPETLASFKTKPGLSVPTVQAESTNRDIAPGQTTTGVVSVRSSAGNSPQIFKLNFGDDQKVPLTIAAVL